MKELHLQMATFLESFFKGAISLTYSQKKALLDLISSQFGFKVSDAVDNCFEEDAEQRFQVRFGVSLKDVFLAEINSNEESKD